MYEQTEAQAKAAAELGKRRFKFSNWISAQDPEHPEHGCMVFKRSGATRYGAEYREVSPDGSIN